MEYHADGARPYKRRFFLSGAGGLVIVVEAWTIQLLGGLSAHRAEQRIDRWGTQKAGALLAYLAFYPNRRHAREALAELLWPETAPEAGLHNLRQALSSLRRQLEPPGPPAGTVFIADRFSIQVNPAGITTDVAAFETALQSAARNASQMEQTQQLSTAVALYNGPLLPGHYEDWVLVEQRRLAELFFEAAGRLIAHLEQTGETGRALDIARRALVIDPLREESHRELIRLLVATGQLDVALRQYRAMERVLEQDLGATPSPATCTLLHRIEEQIARGQVPPPAVSRVLSPAMASAPVPDRAALRAGTVTFLMTDIDGSVVLRERAGPEFEAARERQHTLLRQEFVRYGGHAFKETGDGFLVAFASAGDALACAVACQRVLEGAAWPEETGALRVRMAIYTGDVEVEKNDYHGFVLHRVSRMLTAAHGGQILCSEATATLVRRDIGESVRLTDLGLYRLRDVPGVERLFQIDFPGMAQREFGPLRAEAGFAGNLPPTLTRFFGREEEIERLAGLLRDQNTRLVTMTGPGGTGKTRLALETAGRVLEAFGGAVWFVPLADISDPRLTLSAVQDALRLPRPPGVEPLDQVANALREHPSLLLLDNFEQIVDGGAEVVQVLLTRVPTLRCLVTSRKRLLLGAEREFPVPPLPIPDGADTPERLSTLASVQMFVNRAQAALPDFQVTPRNAPVVAELVRRLEGIPLALELAASRAQVLTPGQMLAQIKHRFDLLATRRRDLPARHRSLRAVLDLSYQMLSPHLGRFFPRLSVFRGGWTAEAAVAVCEEPQALDYLSELRECSLVQAEESGPEIRFRMLETLREYCSEQLSQEEQTTAQRRHADWFLALAEETEKNLDGAEQAGWLHRLAAEHDNLRAALLWYRTEEEGTEAELRLVGAVWQFWLRHGHLREGREWLEGALERSTNASASARIKALVGTGYIAWYQSDFSRVAALGEESLALAREREDKWGVARSLSLLGVVAANQGGDYARTVLLLEESLTLARETGDTWMMWGALMMLAASAYYTGDYERALTLGEESLALGRKRGDTMQTAYALHSLAEIARSTGKAEQAAAMYSQGMALFRQTAELRGVAWCMEDLAKLALGHDQPERATRLLAAAASLRAVCGAPVQPFDRPDYDRAVAAAQAQLGEKAFEVAWAEGRALTSEQAMAYAFGENEA